MKKFSNNEFIIFKHEKHDKHDKNDYRENYNQSSKNDNSCIYIVNTIITLSFIGIFICIICFILQYNKNKKISNPPDIKTHFGYDFN